MRRKQSASANAHGCRLPARGRPASGPSAPRTRRRSCAGASRSSRSSSSRRRRWPWSPSRSGPSACPRRTGRLCRRRCSGSSCSSPRRPVCRAPSSSEEETGTALALRKVAPGHARSWPARPSSTSCSSSPSPRSRSRASRSCSTGGSARRPRSPRTSCSAGYGLADRLDVSLGAGRRAPDSKNVLFVVISFPLLLPLLLLTAIAATVEATRGGHAVDAAAGPRSPTTAPRLGAAYMLASAAWED